MKQDEAGTKCWYKENTDILHRLDGPAVEQANGTKHWYKNGKRHRSDGGPAIEFANGGKYWWENDKPHRLDGPAKEFADGTQEWWVNGYQIWGSVLNLFKQAIDKTTPSSKVGELSRHENHMVAQGAANNPNCPIEDQIEWTLTRGVAK